MDTIDLIIQLAKEKNGHFTTSDVIEAGISRTTLGRLADKGQVIRIERGQYILPDIIPDELYIYQLRSEKIIFSHETALFLLDMAERTPFQHTVTIPSNYKLSPALVWAFF